MVNKNHKNDANHILLIVTGSIAAYKCLDLIRMLKERNMQVTVVMTKASESFVTPMSLAALSGRPVYRDLFDLDDESQMGHIQLSRGASFVVVAPASADILAKMAHGHADDLASTILLATDKPVLVAPAMNHKMWEHPAVQRNVTQIKEDGVTVIEPEDGELACGEEGMGRLASLERMVDAIMEQCDGR